MKRERDCISDGPRSCSSCGQQQSMLYLIRQTKGDIEIFVLPSRPKTLIALDYKKAPPPFGWDPDSNSDSILCDRCLRIKTFKLKLSIPGKYIYVKMDVDSDRNGDSAEFARAHHHQDQDGPFLCRICHTGSATADVLKLGCACKLDLGRAHQACAKKRFLLKGDRWGSGSGVSSLDIGLNHKFGR